tara:strand:- start:1403 stop:2887 length:1485 start_codon:yes stop_codon:yes gene_type:complete
MNINLDIQSVSDYDRFVKIKSLPTYSFSGRTARFPDEYCDRLALETPSSSTAHSYDPIDNLFDYQEAISAMVIDKSKFAVFADCGLGKTLILLEAARQWSAAMPGQSILIVSPLMVVRQTLKEAARFYDRMKIRQVVANELADVLTHTSGEILITNYDALRDDTPQGNIGGLILDESSMLKSHYGKWGQTCLRLGAGLKKKLALTGTPAPNDRIEYANHAVFLDAFPTVNSFLARYFVNRGQTDNRWELKPHALRPFYRSLSHWCIFLTNPATYGWRDNCENIPPIKVHIHDVSLTPQQQDLAFDKTGSLFADQIGGITSRSVLSQIAKGSYRGERIDTNKPAEIVRLVNSWPDESTIIWCKYNAEQAIIAEQFPAAHSIDGSTTYEDRESMIEDFKAGRCHVLISKPKILGFGLNLQIATRQIFSGLQDSYEEFYQAVKRSNRYGSTRPLNVHIPVTDIERPMIETVLTKARRVEMDTETQERLFKEGMNTNE